MAFNAYMNGGQDTSSYAATPVSVGVNTGTWLCTLKNLVGQRNERTAVIMMSIASDLKTIQVFTNFSGNVSSYSVTTTGYAVVKGLT